MPTYMDVHTIGGGVSASDVAGALQLWPVVLIIVGALTLGLSVPVLGP